MRTKVTLVLAVLATGLMMMLQADAAAQVTWLGAFGHAPTAYNPSPQSTIMGHDGNLRVVQAGYAPLPAYRAETTVREVVLVSAAAQSIRIRLSNEFGDKALRIGEVHVALSSESGEILPDSDHVLTFAGQRGAVIPPGAPLLSDPVDWTIPALARLAVSVFYPDATVPPAHTLYALKGLAAPGNQTGSVSLVEAVAARSGNHLSEVDIVPREAGHTVVCFGDSITEGVASTVGGFRGWPDRLVERLQANPSTRGWSVLNAGIGSNRLLHDIPSTNALSRFDRDVLGVPGVTRSDHSSGNQRHPVQPPVPFRSRHRTGNDSGIETAYRAFLMRKGSASLAAPLPLLKGLRTIRRKARPRARVSTNGFAPAARLTMSPISIARPAIRFNPEGCWAPRIREGTCIPTMPAMP